jgi:hypothetical protein
MLLLLISGAVYYFGIQKGVVPITINFTSTPTATIISNEDQCIKDGGEWQKIGTRPTPGCLIKLKDAGKECHGKNDCIGACLAPKGIKPGEESIGTCSTYNIYLGCFNTVDNGEVSPTICVD